MQAQNVNFSQFHYSPTQTNPGMIATSNQTKVIFNYRSQFIGAGQAFTTPAISVIYPWLSKGKTQRKAAFALSAMSDKTGENGILQTNGILASAAANFNLNPVSGSKLRKYISVGLQGGFFQRTINQSLLSSGSQWTGSTFDPGLPINEQIDFVNKSFPIIHFGTLFYAADTCDRIKAYFGVNVQNINQPNVSYFTQSTVLPYHLVVTGGIEVFNYNNFSIQPNFRWVQEANADRSDFFTFARQIRLGSLFYYNLAENESFIKEGNVGLGLWYDNTSALTFSLEFNQPNYFMAFSYDLGASAPKNALGSGAVEIAMGLKFGKQCLEPRKPRDESIKDTTRLEIKGEKGDSIYTIVATIIKDKVISTDTINVEFRPYQPGDIKIPSDEVLEAFKKKSYFYYLSDDINKASASLLDQLSEIMLEYRGIKIEIVGHTCNIGATEQDNNLLSLRRSEAVKKYLMAKGVEENRIQTSGFGSARPVLSNDSEYGRIKNRRVEFRVIETGKR